MKRLLSIVLFCVLVPCAYGETITHTFDNGDKYVGEVKNGKWHGQGTFTWADGAKYVGQFKDGLPQAKGAFTVNAYRALLVPRLWRRTLEQQSQIYQEQSIPEILEEELSNEEHSEAYWDELIATSQRAILKDPQSVIAHAT